MLKKTRAAAALIVLLALTVGVPVLLISTVGNPYPPGGFSDVGIASDAAVLGLMAVIGWLFWAQMTACVLWEIPAAIGGRHASRVPLATGGQQQLARTLVQAVAALGLGTLAVSAAAVPQADAAPVVGTHTAERAVVPPDRVEPVSAATSVEAGMPEVTVRSGDTLWGLAERHLGTGERWREIARLNQGRDMGTGIFTSAGMIRTGWVLRLPSDATNLPLANEAAPIAATTQVTVEDGDSLWTLAADNLGDANQWPHLYEQNRDVVGADPDLIHPGQVIQLPSRTPGDRAAPTPAGESGGSTQTPVRPSEPLHPVTPPSPTVRPNAEPNTVPRTDRVERTESQRASTPSADAEDTITTLRALLATATCLSGGLLAMVVANRRRQFRQRRSGRIIAPTPPELVEVERAVWESGTLATGNLDFIDRALRHLAASQRAAGVSLPNLGAAVIDDQHLTVLFTEPAPSAPPLGWASAPGERAWSLPRATELMEDLLEQPAPYPALVSVGIDSDGRSWMLDLECAGVVAVSGDAASAADTMRFLTAELALNPWSEGVEVMLTGGFATETVGLNPERLRSVDVLDDAVRRGIRQADRTTQATQVLGRDVLETRRDAIGVDSTSPVVLVTAGPAPADLTTMLAEQPRSRVVVIHRDSHALIDLVGDGKAYLPWWDVTVEVFALGVHDAADMSALVASTTRIADAPMPPADEESPTGRVATVDGALRGDLTSDRDEASAGRAGSLLPADDEIYLEVGATTTEDLAALAPGVPDELRDRVAGMDPGLDEDLAAWRDPASSRPRVRLLGPVQVDTCAERREEVANRVAVLTELIAYLACRDHGATPEQAAEALGVKPKTLHNRVAEARKLLGDDPGGQPWLPEASLSPTGRTRGMAIYQLAEAVLVDADLFRRLRLRGQAQGPDGIADLTAALSLVTGRPFDQLRPGGYGFLAETPVDQYLTAAIVDVAHVVVLAALAAGDTQLARRACETAILAAPDEDKPRLDLAAIETAEGNTDVDRSVADQVCNRTEDDLTERSAAVIRQRGWLAS